MRYKLNYEPLHELEGIAILKNILNGRTIKSEREEIIKKRGDRYKSVITQFFKIALELESYIKEKVVFTLPGYIENGQQLAEFLFKERGKQGVIFADVLFFHAQYLQNGIDNKELAILVAFDHDYVYRRFGASAPPAGGSARRFFALLEECNVDDDQKLDILRLYHNFDMYFEYAKALLADVKMLISHKTPRYAAALTMFMDDIALQLDSNSASFLQDNFNVALDDTHEFLLYPGLYNVNSVTFGGSAYSDRFIVFSLHFFDIGEIFKNVKSENVDAESFLKCLSDNTKLNILKLLKNNPMYGSQLAEKLDCTNANISYHMSPLIALNVVSAKRETNRVYYYLNMEDICAHFDSVKGLFM